MKLLEQILLCHFLTTAMNRVVCRIQQVIVIARRSSAPTKQSTRKSFQAERLHRLPRRLRLLAMTKGYPTFVHCLSIVILSLSFSSLEASASPLKIVGSSAVFPFAATVAEHFHQKTNSPTPLVEAIGSGAGIKLFCASLQGPDGAISSRPMTPTERENCTKAGVNFEEFKVGQDGLVLVQAKADPLFPLTLSTLRSALFEEVMVGKSCQKNPYQMWSQINPALPASLIRVLGPAPTSGTYDILLEKLHGPCPSVLRHDGGYTQAPANENLIIQKVRQAERRIGIITYGFYDQNRAHLNALSINQVSPSLETIQEGHYPLTRPLFLYVKTNDIKATPTLVAYVAEFLSKAATGPEGYLLKKGLIPLSPQAQQLMKAKLQALQLEATP